MREGAERVLGSISHRLHPHQRSPIRMDVTLDEITLSQLLGLPDVEGFNWEPCTFTLHNLDGCAWPHMAAEPRPENAPLLSVTMDRPLIASPSGHEWVWYKNCVLPPLKIKCELPQLEDLSCLLSAVQVDVSSHAVYDVGLEGDTLRPLVHASCSFSSLSFKTTSYNLKGKPIHLFLTLLQREKSTGQLCVMGSMISPPITVAARKRQASEKARGNAPNANAQAVNGGDETGLLPFMPNLLEQKMEKVEKIGQQAASRRPIENTLEGLCAYLSATNIRNKCKHPLFLVLRFHECVALFYDSTKAPDPLQDDGAFYSMMEVRVYSIISTPHVRVDSVNNR